MSEVIKSTITKLREVPLVGWLLAAVVGLVLVVVMLLSRLQAQRDHHRRLVDAARIRRKLADVDKRADEVAAEEKQEAREVFEETERKLRKSEQEILALEGAKVADEVNRFFDSMKPKKKLTVEDLRP